MLAHLKTINVVIKTTIMWMFVKTIITNFIFRQEAVDYMVANTALSRVAVEREVKIFFECQYFFKIDLSHIVTNPLSLSSFSIFQVDRYITWPGQATAYKVWLFDTLVKELPNNENVNTLKRVCKSPPVQI